MTKQTWTAAVSALLFVVLAAVIALVPVPYVTWSAGSTHDLLGSVQGQPAISIAGAPTYPATGELLMTTVAVTKVDSPLSLPEVLFSYWLPAREVLPRDAVYPPGVADVEVKAAESQLMNTAQSAAVVAALREARVPVTEMPMVTSVSNAGPANGKLKPGDLIKEVDNVRMASVQAVRDAIADRHVGEPVLFTLIRDGVEIRETVTTVASTSQPDVPAVGAQLSIGYRYAPQVSFGIDPGIGGSSAGLMFAVAIYEKLTNGDLTQDRVIAGTGAVNADGRVIPIGGVREKVAGAARDGAAVFLLPAANCADLTEIPRGLRLVPVETLADALTSIESLADPERAGTVAGCP